MRSKPVPGVISVRVTLLPLPGRLAQPGETGVALSRHRDRGGAITRFGHPDQRRRAHGDPEREAGGKNLRERPCQSTGR